jgi:hypothetical protein
MDSGDGRYSALGSLRGVGGRWNGPSTEEIEGVGGSKNAPREAYWARSLRSESSR